MKRFALIACTCALFAVHVVDGQSPKDAPQDEPKMIRNEPKAGEVVEVAIANGVKMKLCWIPAGEAQLGSPKAERQEVLKEMKEDKEPEWLSSEAEEVRGKFKTKGFWLGKYPVTQEEWEAMLSVNPSYFSKSGGGKEKVADMNTNRFPVENVSWEDCQRFLKVLNKEATSGLLGQGKFSLPHEDEWEYACRGGKGNKQPCYFGDKLNGKQANCDGNHPFDLLRNGPYLERTYAVGSYEEVSPHPWGLCDITGNIYQWCDNLFSKDKPARVVRGGSWHFLLRACRCANRNWFGPGDRFYLIGFRVAFKLD